MSEGDSSFIKSFFAINFVYAILIFEKSNFLSWVNKIFVSSDIRLAWKGIRWAIDKLLSSNNYVDHKQGDEAD